MGYSNPKININKSLSVINNEIRNFQGKFDEALGEANDRRIENFNANVEALEKAKAKKLMGEDAWYQQYGKYEPKGGYEKGVESYLKNMHDKYYNLIGCDEPECIAQRRALLNMPKELSEDAGAFDSAQSLLNESLSKVGVNNDSVVAGGFNAFDTPAKFREILQNGGKLVPVFNEETLHTDYKMVDENGEQKGDLISGRDFTQSILKGEQTVATYGDPGSIAAEIHKKSYDELKIESLGISEIDKTDPAYQTKVKDYTQARQVYNESIKDPRLYEPTLNNVNTMRRSWPVMITDMVKLARTEDEGSEEARIALGPLLGGEDGKFGGDYSEDDNAYTPQAAAGQWDNSELHRNIALTYFTRDNPADNIMPPLEKQITSITKGTGKDKSMTDYQAANLKYNRDKLDKNYEIQLKKIEAASKNSDSAANRLQLDRIKELRQIDAAMAGGNASPGQVKSREILLKQLGLSDESSTTTNTTSNAKPVAASGSDVDGVSGQSVSVSNIGGPFKSKQEVIKALEPYRKEGTIVSYKGTDGKDLMYIFKNKQFTRYKP